MATRGVFGGDSHPLTPSQEEKDRERRITYLEEKVRKEVERRKDAEAAIKRLNRSTGEQRTKWEEMAGWSLQVSDAGHLLITSVREGTLTLSFSSVL